MFHVWVHFKGQGSLAGGAGFRRYGLLFRAGFLWLGAWGSRLSAQGFLF